MPNLKVLHSNKYKKQHRINIKTARNFYHSTDSPIHFRINIYVAALKLLAWFFHCM